MHGPNFCRSVHMECVANRAHSWFQEMQRIIRALWPIYAPKAANSISHRRCAISCHRRQMCHLIDNHASLASTLKLEFNHRWNDAKCNYLALAFIFAEWLLCLTYHLLSHAFVIHPSIHHIVNYCCICCMRFTISFTKKIHFPISIQRIPHSICQQQPLLWFANAFGNTFGVDTEHWIRLWWNRFYRPQSTMKNGYISSTKLIIRFSSTSY